MSQLKTKVMMVEVKPVMFEFKVTDDMVVHVHQDKWSKQITTLANARLWAQRAQEQGVPDAQNRHLQRVNYLENLPLQLEANQILQQETSWGSLSSDLAKSAQQALDKDARRQEQWEYVRGRGLAVGVGMSFAVVFLVGLEKVWPS